LPRSRRALFWLMVVVFVGVFMPVPMREIPGNQANPAESAESGTSASLER
jgi:hypothetical protein